MKYRITCFSLFLSIVFSLIVGAYHYPFVTAVLFHILLFFLVIFSYRMYLIVEKAGVFVYEKYIKKRIEDFQKTKKELQK